MIINKKLTLIFGFVLGILFSAVLFNNFPQGIAATDNKGQKMRLYNEQGQQAVYWGAGRNGQGVIFLMDKEGQPLVQLGSYEEGLEKGQSLFGLHDRKNALRLLVRLHGAKDSPTVVMKDDAGRDRIVFGLDGQTQDPYFQYYDAETQEMRNLF